MWTIFDAEPCQDQHHATSCASSDPRTVPRLSETTRTVLRRRHRPLKRPVTRNKIRGSQRATFGRSCDRREFCRVFVKHIFVDTFPAQSGLLSELLVAPLAFWSWAARLVFSFWCSVLVFLAMWRVFLFFVPGILELFLRPDLAEFKNSVSL